MIIQPELRLLLPVGLQLRLLHLNKPNKPSLSVGNKMFIFMIVQINWRLQIIYCFPTTLNQFYMFRWKIVSSHLQNKSMNESLCHRLHFKLNTKRSNQI